MRSFDQLIAVPANTAVLPISSIVNLPELAMNSQYGLVVDITNTEPEDGTYSIARFNSRDPKLYLVEPSFVDCDGETRCRLMIPGRTLGGFSIADGPYDLHGENAWYLRSKLVGRVLGYVQLNCTNGGTGSDFDRRNAPQLQAS